MLKGTDAKDLRRLVIHDCRHHRDKKVCLMNLTKAKTSKRQSLIVDSWVVFPAKLQDL